MSLPKLEPAASPIQIDNLLVQAAGQWEPTGVQATLRTNYFQRAENGDRKLYVSFKLDSQQVPELP